LEPAFALDLSHGWWRRQYAPHLAPESHRPHRWHQDGALGYDFVANPSGSSDASSLLPLTTCWIALTPCGVDAPGLELIGAPCVELLGLHALEDAALRARFDPTAFERPNLAAGDALLFVGAVPHRTHVAPSMRRTRTSLELRFFGPPAQPAGLRSTRRALNHPASMRFSLRSGSPSRMSAPWRR
jgi:ectoine hydroxylase-related dioxygenase (phytanoyl-CoA dioxygenase family)